MDFDVERLQNALTALGFQPRGKHWDPFADIRLRNDEAFFDSLYDLLASVVSELEETLQRG